MIKKYITYGILIFVCSCSNVEFVLNDKISTNPLKDKTTLLINKNSIEILALNEKISKYLELQENQKVLGYLYVGTASGKQKKIPEMDTSEFVTQWI